MNHFPSINHARRMDFGDDLCHLHPELNVFDALFRWKPMELKALSGIPETKMRR